MRSLLGPSPLVAEEQRLQATAETELQALRAAEVGTNALAYMVELPGFAPDNPTVPTGGFDQERALVFISTIALRAARSLIALVRTGYEEEALVFVRVLAEAKGRAMRVVEDDSGEHARQWLAGRGGKPAKANRELPQDVWTGLSASAHVDVTSILRNGLEEGKSTVRLENRPSRWLDRANWSLALCGSQAADVAFSLAYLRGVYLPEEGEFIQLVKTTLETYAPGEDAEAWTSGEGDPETLRVDR